MPGFGFVMNIASLADAEYTLASGNVLRRATDHEVAAIKEKLGLFNLEGIPGLIGWTWEKRLFRASGLAETLPREQWRYFVIAFEGTNHEIENIQTASCLASLELEVGFTIIDVSSTGAGFAWHPDRLLHTVGALRLNDSLFNSLTTSNIAETISINAQLRTCSPEIRRLVQDLQSLKGLPHYSPLRFLGYFAILEAVLTHAPKPEDRYDSIIRQVKKKLALLDARWTPKIDYRPFMGTQAEKVWSKMYEYRSAIAHGGSPNFDGDLRLLRGPVEALRLIKETAKAVLRQALIEPELLRDLREC